MRPARAAALAVSLAAVLCVTGCGLRDSKAAARSPEPASDPMDKVWRTLGLNDEQILDLKARSEARLARKAKASGDAGALKEVWELHENKPEVLKAKLIEMLDQLRDELREAPTYIQEGIKSYEKSQDEHAAEIEKALKSLPSDSSTPQS
jgi:hypothetical protein